MYSTHNPEVRKYAQSGEKELEQTIAFVFASIRVQTSMLPKMMKEFRKRGTKSSWIWGNKRTGIQYVRKNRRDLYTRMMRIIRSKKSSISQDLIMLFLEVPGLGLPKAGFVCQLVAGKAGCLDVHNFRKYLPEVDASKGTPSYLQTSGNSLATKEKKAHVYLDIIEKKCGGTRKVWDNWCAHMSMLYPHHFPTPWHVSNVHKCIWEDQKPARFTPVPECSEFVYEVSI
jgi:hypothetical protein